MTREDILRKLDYLIEDTRRLGISVVGIMFLKEDIDSYISSILKERDDALSELARMQQAACGG